MATSSTREWTQDTLKGRGKVGRETETGFSAQPRSGLQLRMKVSFIAVHFAVFFLNNSFSNVLGFASACATLFPVFMEPNENQDCCWLACQ